LKRYAKNKGCAVCREPTGGNFKTAHKLIKKIAKRKAEEEAEAGKEEEEKGDVSSGIQGVATTGWTIPGGDGRYQPQKRV